MLTWDETGAPTSKQFEENYFSKLSALEESRFVFIGGNRLIERWTALQEDESFTIVEAGFGTGLNFLSTWQSWRSCKNNNSTNLLHFISLEKYPLSRSQLKKALSLWPELALQAQQLVDRYPPQGVTDVHRITFPEDRIILTLYFGDASEGLRQFSTTEAGVPVTDGEQHSRLETSNSESNGQHQYAFGANRPRVDAWYLDGFSPAKNPQMWTEDLFFAMAELSENTTSFATFTSVEPVVKGLTEAGFECKKIQEVSLQKEILAGTFNGCTNREQTQSEQPISHSGHAFKNTNKGAVHWHLVKTPNNKNITHVVVIGGGLAGCHTAFALAQKNIRVTLLERSNSLAKQASGNHQSVVYAKLSPAPDPLSRFNLAAQIYANQFYREYAFYQKCGDQCGVLHQASNPKQTELFTSLAKQFTRDTHFVRYLSPQDCRSVSGIKASHPGLFVPQAGWIDPKILCAELTDHPLINVITTAEVAHLQRENLKWNAFDAQQAQLAQGDAIVVATAYDALNIEQSAYLPLKTIRGQVTHLRATKSSQDLKTVICNDGYIAPAFEGIHTLGASFNLNDDNTETTIKDHRDNVAKLAAISPDIGVFTTFSPSELQSLQGRVGFRCTTPDYLPIVGPLAHAQVFLERFKSLRRNAQTYSLSAGAYYPKLFTNLGYGSRGLCYAPLCAELLASIISGEFLPATKQALRQLHPARFLVRDLGRNRI